MKVFKLASLPVIYALMFTGAVHAEENTSAIKLGFGIDRDFGIVGSIERFNGFIGNDGMAVDYIFATKKLDQANPLYGYVGIGGFGDWDGDFGIRLPVGGEIYFAENMDAFFQLIPRLRFNHDHNKNKNNDVADFGLDFGIGVRYQF